MVLYFLTSSALEIGTAITVWSIKQLYNGAVYLLSSNTEEIDNNNSEYGFIYSEKELETLKNDNRLLLEHIKKIENKLDIE